MWAVLLRIPRLGANSEPATVDSEVAGVRSTVIVALSVGRQLPRSRLQGSKVAIRCDPRLTLRGGEVLGDDRRLGRDAATGQGTVADRWADRGDRGAERGDPRLVASLV